VGKRTRREPPRRAVKEGRDPRITGETMGKRGGGEGEDSIGQTRRGSSGTAPTKSHEFPLNRLRKRGRKQEKGKRKESGNKEFKGKPVPQKRNGKGVLEDINRL